MPSIQDAVSIDSSSVMSSEIYRRHNEDIKTLVATINDYRAKQWIDDERSKKYLRIIDTISNGQGKPFEYGEKIFKMKKRLKMLKKEHKMKDRDRASLEGGNVGNQRVVDNHNETTPEHLEAKDKIDSRETAEVVETVRDGNDTEDAEVKKLGSPGRHDLDINKMEDEKNKLNFIPDRNEDISPDGKADADDTKIVNDIQPTRSNQSHAIDEEDKGSNHFKSERREAVNQPKDLIGVLSHEDIQSLFVEMCTFARMGFLQPPSCLHCAYKGHKQNKTCDNLVVWRQNAGGGHRLHPEKLEGNLMFVTCSTAQAWIKGEESHCRKWDSDEKILLKT